MASPMLAIAGVARAGATLSNAVPWTMFIAINGVQVANARATDTIGILYESISITDAAGETPSYATFRTKGFAPVINQPVVITLGSRLNYERHFAGVVLSTKLTYFGKPSQYFYDVSCVDHTHGLNRLIVSKRWLNQSVTAIAQDILATWCPGYFATAIQPDLPELDEFTITDGSAAEAFTRLQTRIGAPPWYCDYHKAVHLFLDESMRWVPPRAITPTHESLVHESLVIAKDGSQQTTRVIFEGGGPQALASVAVGDTRLPVETGAWHPTTGGQFKSGPQHGTYTGVDLGGDGSLVGPGASPSAPLVSALASGAGVESGDHDHAVVFVTAAGKSIPGPRATITVGLVAPPSTAPTAGAATIGTGPNPGEHLFATTGVTASGQTTQSPTVARSTGLTPAPSTAPTAGTPTPGTGPDTGMNHDWCVTFTTAIGETTESPLSAAVATTHTAAPASAPTPASPTGGSGPDVGAHTWAVTNVTPAGETTSSPVSSSVTTSLLGPAAACSLTQGVSNEAGGSLIGIYGPWAVCFRVAGGGETEIVNASVQITCNGPGQKVRFTDIPIGPAGTVSRVLYRLIGGQYKTITVLNDNTTQGYVDDTLDGSAGADAPAQVTGGTAYLRVVALSGIAIGPSGTTQRKLYRTAAGGSQQKLLATIADNSTTTFNDTIADASLGANIPTTNTAVACAVPLTGIPIGDANVTARKVYRRSDGFGPRLVATIANNTATTYTDTTPNSGLGAAAPTVSTAYLQRIPLTLTPPSSPLVTSVNIYGTAAGGSQLKLIANVATATTAYTVVATDASLGADVPIANTATANQVSLTDIAIGPAGTTAREIYRTPLSSPTLKLQQTIADNVTTTATDATADASLGADAPSSDASGLPQPDGVILAGSTSLITAGAAWALSTGGWAVIGNGAQVIRYTGKTGQTITGIPPDGPGAIVATIAYNSTITAAPMLIGIPASGAGSIRTAITKGDDVNLLMQADDLVAQAALAAASGYTFDGIIEEFLQDRRVSAPEALARAQAHLARRKDERVTVTFQTRDITTRAGRTIAVAMPGPFSLSGTFLIQSVAVADFDPRPEPIHAPLYTVTASTELVTFEGLVRALREKAS